MAKQSPKVEKKAAPRERSAADIRSLVEALKKFEQITVDGKIRSPFDQFLEKLGAIRYVGVYMQVLNPHEYAYWSDLYGYYQTTNWYQYESILSMSPTENEKYMDMVRSHKPSFLVKTMPSVDIALLQ